MVVVDASVIVALVVPDPRQAEVQDLLAAWLEEGTGPVPGSTSGRAALDA